MRAVLTLALLAVLVAAPSMAYASDRDGRAGQPYTCNPQAECLARAATLRGPAGDAARKDCSRMPKQGTCFSPDDAQGDRASGRTDFDRTDGRDRGRR